MAIKVQTFEPFNLEECGVTTIECNELDRLALIYGTDKSTATHSYTLAYEGVFGPTRLKVESLLEIGLEAGGSIRMWEEYFPNAKIYGMDSRPQCKKYETPRTKVFIGDQASEHDLQVMVRAFQPFFDIIIDDGGHFMNQQITSFRCLFPYVRPRGWYVIEDLHTSYHNKFGGALKKEGTMVELAKSLIDDLNKGGKGPADPNRALEKMRIAGYSDPLENETTFKTQLHLKGGPRWGQKQANHMSVGLPNGGPCSCCGS